jgi:transposase
LPRRKKSDQHTDPDDPPRRRANNRPGHGTFANDRPPVYQIISRQTGEVRIWVLDRTDKANTQAMLQTLLPPGAILYSDELSAYNDWPAHFTVCHSKDEWARDDNGDGVREVHCNTCEGAHTGLRTFLRIFRGVHKAYLACYLAVWWYVEGGAKWEPDILYLR